MLLCFYYLTGFKSLINVFLAEYFMPVVNLVCSVRFIAYLVFHYRNISFLLELSISTNLFVVFICNKFISNIIMLFGGRSVSPLNTKTKSTVRQPQPSKSPVRKQPTFKPEAKAATYNKAQLKTKQTMGILYSLEQIYNQLNFNEFDAFAQEKIVEARKKIERLCTFYKDEPICPKHQDLLNLYCQNEKQVICVSCVYKGNQQHKNHKIRPLETVEKTLQYEIIRNQQKAKGLVNQLSIIQQQILQIEKQICQNFMNISNNSINIINETIKQLESMKQQYDNKLSLAYRRTNTIVKRYNQSLDLMVSLLDSNLQKASTMKGLGKYLLLKQINKESDLMEELINKFNENKVLMEQWKKSMKETEKIIVKKKKQKFRKEDVYVVTEF